MSSYNKPQKLQAGQSCEMDCKVCYRLDIQVKGLLAMSGLLVLVLGGIIGAIIVDRSNIQILAQQYASTGQQYIYVVQSVNDIKDALGLKIRPVRNNMDMDIRESLPGSDLNRKLTDPQSSIDIPALNQ